MTNRTILSRVGANEEAISSLKTDMSALKAEQGNLLEKVIRMDETVKNQGQQQQIAIENQNRTLADIQRTSIENHKETQEFVKKLIGEYQDPVDKVFNRVEELSEEFKGLSNALLLDGDPKALKKLSKNMEMLDQNQTDRANRIMSWKERYNSALWYIMIAIAAGGTVQVVNNALHNPTTQITVTPNSIGQK